MKRFLVLLCTLWAGIAQATVTGTVTENTYACNGTQTAYPTTFRFLASTDLTVTKTTAGITSALALTTDYTVTGAKAATGTVTLTAGSKCPSGSTLTITRTLPMTQGTAFRSQGSFSPALHEDAFDRLVMVDQQLSRDDGLARADIADLEAFVNGLAAGGQVVIPKTWTLAGDGSATTFALPGADLSSAASYYVTIDGLSQIPTADFSVSGGADTITFTSAPPVGSVIEVRCLTYAKAQSVADATTITATGSTTARSLADRAADVANVRDFGALGDGTTDDTPAFLAAIDAAYASSNFAVEVYIPVGRYRLTQSGVLSRNAGASRRAVKFRGAGRNASILYLEPQAATDTWFFISTDKLQFADFEGLSFESQGANQAFAHLMKLGSTAGQEQGHRFAHCDIGTRSRLNNVLLLQGTTNASEVRFEHTRIKNIYGYVTRWENQQAVNITFDTCDVEQIWGDVFQVASQGGGNAQILAGSWIWGYDNTVDRYLVDVVGSASVQHSMVFVGTRFEARSTRAMLFRKTNTAGVFDLQFIGVDAIPSADDLANYNAVTIDAGATLTFTQSVLPKSWGYTVANTSSGLWTQRNPGTLRFRDSAVPGNLSELITFTSNYGIANARGCWARLNDGGTAAFPEVDTGTAVDFDLGWQHSTRGSSQPVQKVAVLKSKAGAWPKLTSGSGLPSNEREATVRLPVGSVITGFRIYKPASGASTASYQLKVGNGNKTVTHASSTLAQYKDAHTIDVTLAPSSYIHVGSDANLRTVRLWADPGGDNVTQSNLTGEIALVFYL